MPPRKTAAPRKPRKATEPPASPRPEIAVYEELRDRARDSGLAFRAPAPFELRAGFDPPAVARWPRSLIAREQLDDAMRGMRILTALRVLFGDDYDRVAAEFDKLDDADELMIGLYLKIIDWFNGPGAADSAPGGSPAS